MLICLSVFLVSCQAQKQLGEMHDTTQDLDAQTHELNTQTQEVNKTSKDLDSLTRDLNTVSKDLDVQTHQLNDETKEVNKTSKDLDLQTREVSATSKDLDIQTREVNKETKEVNATSKDINAKTALLVDTGAQLNKSTYTLLDLSKHATTLDLRTKMWPVLLQKQPIPPLLISAAKYQSSFEFQVWSDEGMDTAAHRDELAMYSVQEFIGDSQRLFESVKIPVNPMSGNNKEAALNALTATMDVRDRVQNNMLTVHPDVKPMSMLSIIEDSLRADQQIRAGSHRAEPYPSYMNAVIADRDVAIYLLKLRYNYTMYLGLGAAVKEDLTPRSKIQSLIDKAKQYILEKHCGIAEYAPHLPADISKMSDEQIKRLNSLLSMSIETRDFLKSIGVTPEVHCSLRTLVGLIDLSPIRNSLVSAKHDESDPRLQMLRLIENLKTESERL